MSYKDIKILITGGEGTLAQYLKRKFSKYTVIAPSKEELDITNPQKLETYIIANKPQCIIHVAAKTNVDECQQHPEEALKVNAQATTDIARIAKKMNIYLVYTSTAAVFKGNKKGYYEDDQTDPVNRYGESKLLGEKGIMKENGEYLIVRVGWLIGGGRHEKKFISYILDKIVEGKEIKVVNDKVGTITYAEDLANFILESFRKKRKGIYHFASKGICSRFDIASYVTKLLNSKTKITPVSSDYFSKSFFAPRPDREVLLSDKVRFAHTWKESLKMYVSNELLSIKEYTMLMKKTQKPLFSIIICLYKVTDEFYEDLKKYQALNYDKYEILLVTEKNQQLKDTYGAKVIQADKKPISLGEKRDIGYKAAQGVFCAYIDDDAYPDAAWLNNALKVFQSDLKIGAVGGPNITAPNDLFWAQVGGHIYESYLTSAQQQLRFVPKQRQKVLELQGVNLIIRKDILDKIGGFKHHLNSGDDSQVCNEIRGMGYTIMYDPDIKVYHHRRPFPQAHLRQIRNMGKHRGFFVKAHPGTLAPLYFLPAFLTFGLVICIILFIVLPSTRVIFLLLFLLVFLIGYFSSLPRAGLVKSFFVSLGIIATHIVYGLSFLYGLTLQSLERPSNLK